MTPADRREQLLDAAIEVIARDGYSAISIDAIAREADVTRPVVYGVFDDLGALLGALLDRQEKRALEQLLTTLQPGPDMREPDVFLAATVRRLVDVVASDPQTWRPILLAWEGTPEVVARADRARPRGGPCAHAEPARGGLGHARRARTSTPSSVRTPCSRWPSTSAG